MTRAVTRRSCFAALLGAAPLAQAKKKKKNGRSDDEGPLALLGGSVFRAGGRSFPGVEIIVDDPDDPKRKWKAVSSLRGEFVIRVPAAGDPVYRVRAQAKGFRPAEKTAQVYAAQKTNINLILEPVDE